MSFDITDTGYQGEKVWTRDELIPVVERWFDQQTPPRVLAFSDCNMDLSFKKGMFYRLNECLAAYGVVIRDRLPYKVELKQRLDVVDLNEIWERFGGSGIVAGSVDSKRGVFIYHFSKDAEAFFLKMAV